MIFYTTELHEIVQQHGPLEDFKQLYSGLSHENPRSTDLGHQTLLFRYVNTTEFTIYA